MKRLTVLTVTLLVAATGFAQTDTTGNKPDTIKVGNFVIVKKNKPGSENGNRENRNGMEKVRVEKNYHRSGNNLSTNWWILDLGFANLREETNFATAQSSGYLKILRPANGAVTQNSMALNGGKSSNVNIWLFMQKLNVAKHVLNLKYGLGLEMYNIRYDKSLSYRKDPAPFVFNDSINFSKNKLYVGYLTVPFMININATPNKHNGLSISVGVSAGYLVGSHEKQVSAERGKQKLDGDFNLQPWRLAGITELGLGPVRLYGSYSFNALHKDGTGLMQYPYAVGLRFSNW